MQQTANEVLKGVKVIKADAHPIGTVNGTGFEKLGFEEALFILNVGTVGGGGTLDFKIQESEDDGASDAYSDVSGTVITQIIASDKLTLIRLNLRGREKFLRGVLDVAVAAIDAAVDAVLGRFKYPPVTQTADETLSVDA